MKPMLKYRGGKTKELGEIRKFIPKFSGNYVEPFFGGGALFFDLEPERAIINDINISLMTFYKGIRDEYDKVKKELYVLQREHENNRENYEKQKKVNPQKKIPDKNEEIYYNMRASYNGNLNLGFHPATIYYYINKMAYSGMIRYNKKGEYNVPYGRYKNFNTDLISEKHRDLLKISDIYSDSYEKIFNLLTKDDFLFLDPPYDCIFSDYGNIETKDGFTEDMHRKLSLDFDNLGCKALMVISKTDLTKELYGNKIIHEYDKTYSVNIRNRFKSEAKHILVANFEIER